MGFWNINYEARFWVVRALKLVGQQSPKGNSILNKCTFMYVNIVNIVLNKRVSYFVRYHIIYLLLSPSPALTKSSFIIRAQYLQFDSL